MKELFIIFTDGQEIRCTVGEVWKLEKVIEKCAFDNGTRFEIR